MATSKVALIAIGYNKVHSLLRLLDSLSQANYEGDKVPLIISIDNSGNNEVVEFAQKYEWKHGEKIIRTFTERQGLRKHILSCGDYLDEYEAVYVFEDDILASPAFYQYGKLCIDYYKDNENIAGISLYSTKWNQNVNFPFEPMKTEYDTYFLQCAQSWGQIWFQKSWKDFKKWYLENLDIFKAEKRTDIPSNLYTWGENSWLKYHIAYCAIKKKYFVYPYYSFTTAFVENGTHFGTDITRFHSEMMIKTVEQYKLAPFDRNSVFYDTFFENIQLKEQLTKELDDKVMVDLYGCRKLTGEERYCISTQILPYTIKKEFALQLRPIELNIFMDIKGKGIYLYDITKEEKIRKKEKRRQIIKKWDYFMKERFLMWNEIVPLCLQKVKNLFHILMRRV